MERGRRKDTASDLRFLSLVAAPVCHHGERELNAFREEKTKNQAFVCVRMQTYIHRNFRETQGPTRKETSYRDQTRDLFNVLPTKLNTLAEYKYNFDAGSWTGLSCFRKWTDGELL
jgi:uncharacterized protein YbaR (Trm112 family)